MREKSKLVSTAGTGHFYTTTKNKRLHPDKMEVKKFDPKVRKHVAYKEAKIKSLKEPAERRVLRLGYPWRRPPMKKPASLRAFFRSTDNSNSYAGCIAYPRSRPAKSCSTLMPLASACAIQSF